jgi:hypothetical protein
MSEPVASFFLCEETGQREHKGECPVHRGDACLARYDHCHLQHPHHEGGGSLAVQLRTAKLHLEILCGRMLACESAEGHPVSLKEIQAWIEEMEEMLARYEEASDE